jgi:hypothetical protein
MEVQLPNPEGVRKNTLLGGVVWAVASLTFLIGGWLVPAYLLKYDSDIRSDPDFRAGAILPIAMVLGIVFAGLAAKNFAAWYAAPPNK